MNYCTLTDAVVHLKIFNRTLRFILEESFHSSLYFQEFLAVSEKGNTPPFPRRRKSPVASGENSGSEGDDAQIWAMLSKESRSRKQFL